MPVEELIFYTELCWSLGTKIHRSSMLYPNDYICKVYVYENKVVSQPIIAVSFLKPGSFLGSSTTINPGFISSISIKQSNWCW